MEKNNNDTGDEINAEDNFKERENNKKQIRGIGISFFIIVAIFFISYYLFNNLSGFEYQGLPFTKEKFGSISVYHHYYYITPEIKYNLYLRKDPRNNNVPLTGKSIEEIEFQRDRKIYIGIDPNNSISNCEYGSVGISSLSLFLSENLLNVKGAFTDPEHAKMNNITYANCENNPEEMVIEIKRVMNPFSIICIY